MEFLFRKILDVAKLTDSSALHIVIVDMAKNLKIDQTHPVLARGIPYSKKLAFTDKVDNKLGSGSYLLKIVHLRKTS